MADLFRLAIMCGMSRRDIIAADFAGLIARRPVWSAG
jgi:hypothetical protein